MEKINGSVTGDIFCSIFAHIVEQLSITDWYKAMEKRINIPLTIIISYSKENGIFKDPDMNFGKTPREISEWLTTYEQLSHDFDALMKIHNELPSYTSYDTFNKISFLYYVSTYQFIQKTLMKREVETKGSVEKMSIQFLDDRQTTDKVIGDMIKRHDKTIEPYSQIYNELVNEFLEIIDINTKGDMMFKIESTKKDYDVIKLSF